MATSYSPPAYRSTTLPLGVAVLAILIGLVGTFLLIAGVLFFVLSGFAYLHDLAFFGASLLGAVILLIVGVILLVVAVGLWRRELWALAVSILVVLLLIVGRLLTGGLLSLGGVILILLLVYLVLVR